MVIFRINSTCFIDLCQTRYSIRMDQDKQYHVQQKSTEYLLSIDDNETILQFTNEVLVLFDDIHESVCFQFVVTTDKVEGNGRVILHINPHPSRNLQSFQLDELPSRFVFSILIILLDQIENFNSIQQSKKLLLFPMSLRLINLSSLLLLPSVVIIPFLLELHFIPNLPFHKLHLNQVKMISLHFSIQNRTLGFLPIQRLLEDL